MAQERQEAEISKPKAEEGDAQGFKNLGGSLLAERPNDASPASPTSPATAKFESPTLSDLRAVNSNDWATYLADQTKREQQQSKDHPYQTRRDADFNLPEFVTRRREQDERALAKLDEKDLKAVGDVASALAGRDPADSALKAIQQAFGDKYDQNKMEGFDRALRLELERRGLDKTWSTGIAWGPEGASIQIQDKRVNLALNGGTEYLSYQSTIGKFNN